MNCQIQSVQIRSKAVPLLWFLNVIVCCVRVYRSPAKWSPEYASCLVLFCNVKQKIGKIDIITVFLLEKLDDTTVWERAVSFSLQCAYFVNVYHFVCVLLPFGVSWWDVEFDCINFRPLSFFYFAFVWFPQLIF